jgi:hypothetical protein
MSLTVEQVAARAANVVADRGLTKGQMEEHANGGPVCALGAICAALTGEASQAPKDDEGWQLLTDIRERTQLITGRISLAEWNDAKERTAADVVGLFEMVANGYNGELVA